MGKNCIYLILYFICFSYCSSNSNDSPATPSSITLYSTSSEDGNVYFDGISGYGLVKGTMLAWAGDMNDNNIFKAIFSFDILSIPSTAVIDVAILRVYQYEVNGSPYNNLGSVMVDSIKYTPLTLSDDLFNTTVFSTATGSLSSDETVGWKEVYVTALVKADISADRITSQFMLRHGSTLSDNDNTEDSSNWYTGDNSNIKKPELIIKF
jgi:hypothetical protein